jgi:hypothetical protein
MMREETKRQSDEEKKWIAPHGRIGRTASLRLVASPSLLRAGFSFAEVMFAVVVLGIGFIMLASIFPVAIRQTQLNTEETVAIATARNGLAVMTEMATQANPAYPATPPVGATDELLTTTWVGGAAPNPNDLPDGTSLRLGKVVSMKDRRIPNPANYPRRDGMWKAIAGDVIQPGDPRYAWVPLYRRDVIYSNSGGIGQTRAFPFAQVILVGTAVRNRSTYENYDAISPGTVTPNPARIDDAQFYPLEPKPVAVRILPLNDGSGGYYMRIFSISALQGTGFNTSGALKNVYDAMAADAVGEGSFVIISDDRILDASSGSFGQNTGRMNGKIYRVGVRRPDLDEPGNPPKFAWTLQPGFDFIPDPGADGEFYGSGGPGKLKDDINALGVDGLSGATAPTVGGALTNGADIAVAGNANQKGAVAYVIGRGFSVPDPNRPLPPGAPGSTATYEGTTQDVAVYTTFVPAR